MNRRGRGTPFIVKRSKNGFVITNGREEQPVALRHTRYAAEALTRRLNGEDPLPDDAEAMAEPLYHNEFGPDTSA